MTLNDPNIFVQLSETDIPQSLPAPIGGWNTRDNVGAMSATDAITLDNLFPDTRGVKNRGGFTEWATISGDVESLFEFKKQTTRTGLACAGGKIYTFDVTTTGQTPTEIGTGFTNDRWQFVATNNRVVMVNGDDAPQSYDGTTLGAITITGDLAGSGSDMNGIHKHKDRVYLWNTDDDSFYYSDAAAFQGDFTEFPLNTLVGGNIKVITSVSQDTGSGLDDLLAIVTDLGEVLFYSGSNPSSDFSLVQRYQTSRPIDVRGVTRFAGDAYIILEDDFVPLLQYVTSANPEGTKLSNAVVDAVNSYEGNFGFEAKFYGRGKWLFLNVPISTTEAHQYVINSVTGSACRFTGMNAKTFANANKRLFFGGAGKIYRADDGLDDNGANIDLKVQQAFTTIGSDFNKKFNLMKIFIKSLGDIDITQNVAYDYGDALTPQTTTSTSTGSPWDTSDWDTSDWSSENFTRVFTFVLTGTGLAVSPIFEMSINGIDLEWYRTSYTLDILQT